jgi:hypothetical protein
MDRRVEVTLYRKHLLRARVDKFASREAQEAGAENSAYGKAGSYYLHYKRTDAAQVTVRAKTFKWRYRRESEKRACY